VTNFIANLQDWCMKWKATGHSPMATFTMGPIDRPKRSAWLELRDERITAQVTVWVSGECELEADSISNGSVLMRKSYVLEDRTDLEEAVQEVLELFQG
jgi:hypothetical protein